MDRLTEVMDLIRPLKMTALDKGFRPLVLIIALAATDEYKGGTTKSLYEAAAKQLGRKAANVESTIRTLIIKGWKHNPEYLTQLSGKTFDKAPTNTEFIRIIAGELGTCKCVDCGNEISKRAIFCSYCGVQRLDLPPDVAALKRTEEERMTPMPVKKMAFRD